VSLRILVLEGRYPQNVKEALTRNRSGAPLPDFSRTFLPIEGRRKAKAFLVADRTHVTHQDRPTADLGLTIISLSIEP